MWNLLLKWDLSSNQFDHTWNWKFSIFQFQFQFSIFSSSWLLRVRNLTQILLEQCCPHSASMVVWQVLPNMENPITCTLYSSAPSELTTTNTWWRQVVSGGVFQSKTTADAVSIEMSPSDPLQINEPLIRGSNNCSTSSGWVTWWRGSQRWLF